jgi:hypothetical protein
VSAPSREVLLAEGAAPGRMMFAAGSAGVEEPDELPGITPVTTELS